MRRRAFGSVGTVLRWAFTALTLIAGTVTAVRVLHVLATRPVRLGGGPRESEASAILYVGGFVTVMIGCAAVACWIVHWIQSDRARDEWKCACGYDRRGLAIDAKCPECGAVPKK